MYLSPQWPTPVILAFAVLVLPLNAQDKAIEKTAQDSRRPVSAGKDAPPAEEKEEKEKKGLHIGKLLPLNKPNLQVRIPGFDKGELTSMIEAEKLTRIDDVNLKLEDATIQLVPQQLFIRLRTALYNTEGAVLSSNEATTVSSKQFTMTGDSMDFDTKTGKGRMLARPDGAGVVRMIIHNIESMGGDKKMAKPEAAESQGSAAATETETEKEEENKK